MQPLPAGPPAAGLPPPLVTLGALAVLAGFVVVFGRDWHQGGLLIDGPGTSVYVQIVLDHIRQGNGVPYWLPEMWAGTPAFALGPALPILLLLPAGAVLGADTAVKLAMLVFQVLGAWGAFVLARSLWGRTALPMAAGLLYGLHPFFMSHGPFAGAETTTGVLAATPWLVWSLRKALRREGAHHIALGGLFAAFLVLQQAEHSYGVAMLCALVVVVELGRARRQGKGASGPAGVVVRAGLLVVVALGAVAHWLVPFTKLGSYFVLSPPELVRAELFEGTGARVGREIGVFLHRASGLTGTISFNTGDLLAVGSFYLGIVALVLTLVSVVLLPRHDHEGTLTSVLLASLVGVWLSTGAVPLASSEVADKVFVLVVIGAMGGLLAGTFLRHLHLGWGAVVGGLVAAVLLVLAPYVTPFLALQEVVPFLAHIRFPRFYTVAPLALSLGAVFPLVVVQRWAAERRPRLVPLLSSAMALALAGAFLVDVGPYRSFYRLQAPADDAAYARFARELANDSRDVRLGTDFYGDPRLDVSMLSTGRLLSVGWPHPMAGRNLWQVTAEGMTGPMGYRQAALGLSGTGYMVKERLRITRDRLLVTGITPEPNPKVLPLVRTYRDAVVMGQEEVAPVLATSLAQRGIGTVTGPASVARQLGAAGVDTDYVSGCTGVARAADRAAGGDSATACSIFRWMGHTAGHVPVGEQPVGAVFRGDVDGLRAVSVWVQGDPDGMQMVVHELGGDGLSLGPQVARATPRATDENGMTSFTFDPVPGSAGRRYVFLVTCARCAGGDDAPKLAQAKTLGRPGNLVRQGRIQRARDMVFSLAYERSLLPAPASTTTVDPARTGPGRWSITTSGPEPALLVVAETWFPGWEATVDGRPVPVLKADGAFLGVVVDAGSHEVSLSYPRPAASTLGRRVTGVTLALSLVLVVAGLVADRRRRGRAVSSVEPRTPGGRRSGRAVREGPPPPS